MPNPITRTVIDWNVDREAGSDVYRVRGTDTIRDRPIEFTLTAGELFTLAKFLDHVISNDFDSFAHMSVSADVGR